MEPNSKVRKTGGVNYFSTGIMVCTSSTVYGLVHEGRHFQFIISYEVTVFSEIIFIY